MALNNLLCNISLFLKTRIEMHLLLLLLPEHGLKLSFCLVSYFISIYLFVCLYFETRSHLVNLTVMELTMQIRLASNSTEIPQPCFFLGGGVLFGWLGFF